MTLAVPVAGAQFGRWTIVSGPYRKTQSTKPVWACRCSCGTERLVIQNDLRLSKSTSCGCIASEKLGAASMTHGACCGRSQTAEYRAWKAMHDRCRTKIGKAAALYMDRGISVCARWDKYENFLADMGPKPAPHYTLDRENNDGGYEPGNCRWATRRQQNRNTRRTHFITLNGERLCVTEWAARLGIHRATVRRLLAAGKLTAS